MMFKKILSALRFNRIAEISVMQTFPIYEIAPEVYTVIFLENFFERKVDIDGSRILTHNNLWIGTEFYVLTIVPWLNNLITTKELREQLTVIRSRCGNPEKKQVKSKDNNVIELSKWTSNRSTEGQNEV